jgi:hypothetical protein
VPEPSRRLSGQSKRHPIAQPLPDACARAGPAQRRDASASGCAVRAAGCSRCPCVATYHEIVGPPSRVLPTNRLTTMSPKARVCSVPLSSSAARRPEGLVSSVMVSMIVQQALAHAAGPSRRFPPFTGRAGSGRTSRRRAVCSCRRVPPAAILSEEAPAEVGLTVASSRGAPSRLAGGFRTLQTDDQVGPP